MKYPATRSEDVEKKKKRWILLALLAAAIVLAVFCLVASAGDAPGAPAEGERLARMQASPQWRDGQFDNVLLRVDGPITEMISEYFWGTHPNRVPSETPKMKPVDPGHLTALPESGLRVTWMGHSTTLIEIDGLRILVDPVWSERASPFSWAGPARFYAPPIALDELPPIDAVVISHDHYDHLDHETIQELASKSIRWLVPLGVGAHLEFWGVSGNAIQELDWWEEVEIKGVRIVATPSRHFSGRSVLLLDQNATLWAGWAFVGPTRRVFYSGDTALHPEFVAIGERLGPFDLTLMECGAYDQLWSDVHLGPEQAVLAHRLVRGQVMVPVHWGLFDLALHGWTEPVERIIVAARQLNVHLSIPRPGQSIDIGTRVENEKWWPSLDWRTQENAPAWSTSVRELQGELRGPE